MKVLLIGVDHQTTKTVALSLRLRWPDTRPLAAATARKGIDLVEEESPDVVIMQPNFSDTTLFEAIREIRGFSDVPLVVLGHELDEIEAAHVLDWGADTYIRSQIGSVELAVRIAAVLRRFRGFEVPGIAGLIASGPLVINPGTYQVFLDDRLLPLTTTEFRLLYLLAQNRGSVVSHRLVGQTLWGGGARGTVLVRKHVQRLRAKLGDEADSPKWVESVRGVGYRFIGPPEGAPGSRDGRERVGVLAL